MARNSIFKTIAVLLSAILLLTATTPAVFAADPAEDTRTIEEIAHDNVMNRIAARVTAQNGSVAPASDELVKLIVVLDDAAPAAAPGRKNAPALNGAEALRESVKDEIAALDGGSASASGRRGAPKQSSVSFGYDFDVLLNGFAVTAPYGWLEKINAIDGVKEAFAARTYYPMAGGSGSGYENDFSQNFAGADAARAAGYTGKGQLIAVLDTGIDSSHEAFAETDGVKAAAKYNLSKMKSLFSAQALKAEKGGAKAANVFRSAKLPFVFNYVTKKTDVSDAVGHGTHVAGIAAADATATMIGMAPDAQIAVMKVFDDKTGGADDEALLAALEDAALLGVDVVNMSLGADGGFFDYPNETVAQVYNRLREMGVTVAAAAGNSGRAPGDGSDAPTDDPTFSLVADPSTYPAALSVASVNNYLSDALTVGGRTILFTDAIHTDANEKILDVTTHTLGGGKYAYVDCGFGDTADFEGKDLSGKIALISRGGKAEDGQPLTFAAKACAASAAGAKAAVIYNNVGSGMLAPYVIFDGADPIPVVFVSKEDGAYMLAAENKTLSFSFDAAMVTGVSSFSSWGPTTELKLKPEIAAVGGNVYSSVPGGGYENMDGTSMATPQLAGMAALLRQALAGKQTGLSLNALAETLLMNTATPMTDKNGDYSPLKQGAGAANIGKALNAKAYLTVEGCDRPKAELGDGIDKEAKTFRFTVTNLTDAALNYTLSANALAQDAFATEDGVFFKENSVNLLGNGASVSFGGDAAGGRLTVPANGSASATVTVAADGKFAQYAESIGASQGLFLDGFIRLTADAASGPDLGLPYISFYGDWDSVTLIRDMHLVGGDELNAVLGVDPFGEPFTGAGLPDVLWDKLAVSPASAFSRQFVTLTGLTKNSDLHYTLTDKNGKILSETDQPNARRSFYLAAAQQYFYPELDMDPMPSVQVGDQKGKALLTPGETYTYTVSAKPVGGGDAQSFSFDFLCDADEPTVDYKIAGDGETLTFTVEDLTALAGFGVYGAIDTKNAEMTFSNLSGVTQSAGDFFTVKRTGDNSFAATVDLKGLLAQMHRQGKDARYIVIAATDYALNETDVVIDMVREGAEGSVPCNYCGKYHTGFGGAIIRFFHNILYFFQKLFGKK